MSTMKASLHTVSYAGLWPGQAGLSLENTIRRAAEFGYAGVMIMAKRPHLSVLDVDDATIAALKDLLGELGLSVGPMAAYTNFSADAEHGEVPMGEIQVLYITRLAEITHRLGGDVIRIFTAYNHPKLDHWALRDRCIKGITECAQRAADFGCRIAVQNHHGFAVDYQSLADLIADIDEPNCGLGFDAWSPALRGTDIVAAARQMAPMTYCTTSADYILQPRFNYIPELVNYEQCTPLAQAVPMGQGTIDYEGFLNALREGGFDGWATYEMCSPLRGGGELENLDRYAETYIEFMQPWLG
jgi:sugar phosphate isomerase/epimerase